MIEENLDPYGVGYGLIYPRNMVPSLLSHFLKSARGKKLRVFEIGFGLGNTAKMFININVEEYVGVEYSKQACQQVNRANDFPNNFTFINADINVLRNLPIFSNFVRSFDLVIDSASLQHVTNEKTKLDIAIETTADLLKDNGTYLTQWSGIQNPNPRTRFPNFVSYEDAKEIIKKYFVEKIEYKNTNLKTFPEQTFEVVEYGSLWSKLNDNSKF